MRRLRRTVAAETGDEAIVGASEGAEGQCGHRLSVSRKSLIETHCLRGLAKQCIHWKFNFEICRRKTRSTLCYTNVSVEHPSDDATADMRKRKKKQLQVLRNKDLRLQPYRHNEAAKAT